MRWPRINCNLIVLFSVVQTMAPQIESFSTSWQQQLQVEIWYSLFAELRSRILLSDMEQWNKFYYHRTSIRHQTTWEWSWVVVDGRWIYSIKTYDKREQWMLFGYRSLFMARNVNLMELWLPYKLLSTSTTVHENVGISQQIHRKTRISIGIHRLFNSKCKD